MPTVFQWHEDETDQHNRPTGRSTPVVPPVEKRHRKWPRYVGIALLFLFAIAAGVGGAFWFMVQRGQRAAQRDLGAVVRLEAQALARGDQELYRSFQDSESARQLTEFASRIQRDSLLRDAVRVDAEQPLRVVKVDLVEDRAWAEVAFTREGEPYLRMQFYRLTEGRWRRTLPDADFWGERREYTTEHLRFVYHAREEAIVASLARWAEKAYEKMLKDFMAVTFLDPVIIEFRTDTAERGMNLVSGEFSFPSPLLLGYRADGKADDLLRYSLAYNMALYAAIRRSGQNITWSGGNWLMVNAVVLWEVEQLAPSGGPWTAADRQEILRQTVRDGKLLPLAALWPPYDFLLSDRELDVAIAQGQAMLDYAKERFDPSAIPAFLSALGDRVPVAETVQTAFKVDRFKFEAEWLEWLKVRYGPPS